MTVRARHLTGALLMSAWGGAALLTIAVVAPGAFRALPSRSMAGLMVGQVLPAVFVSGMVVGLGVVLLMLPAVMEELERLGRNASSGAAATALATTAACALAQFAIDPRIERIRAAAGGAIDTLSPDDPRRVMFGLLHGYSVGALAIAMLAGAVALIFLLYGLRSDAPAASSPQV